MKKHILNFIIGLTLFAAAPFAYAQSATATLSGTVVDPQNANVVGATVKAVNTETNLERKTTTNGEGYFTLPLLPPGNYTLNVEQAGFASIDKRDVILNVGDQRSLLIQLRVSGVAATVNVTSEASLLNESPSVGTVVDRTFLENLPLNGRSLQSLIFLTPGAIPTATVGASRQGQFSVNGQRESANYFTIDGVSANLGIAVNANPFGNSGQYPGYNAVGATNSLVAIDALQEFKIQTSTFAPEYGRTPGAQVSLITRSGANDFHGSLFEYFRNEALDANDWFANRGRIKKQPLRQNQFGGAFSGPLYLPRFGEGGPTFYNGRNRTFFFVSYEGLKVRLPQVAVAQTTSLSARQTATGAVKSILEAFPVPNGPDFNNGLAQFTGGWSDPSNAHAVSLRVDHNVGSKLTIFGRYSYSPSERLTRVASSLANVTETQYRIQTFTSGATYAASSRVTNDFRFNYSRNIGSTIFTSDGFGGGVPLPDAAVFPSFASSLNSQISIFLTSANTPNLSIGARSGNSQQQYNFVDTLAVVSGAHQMKFGVDYRWLKPTFAFANYNQSIFFNNVAQALAGRAARVSIGAFNGPIYPRFTNLSFFAQDTWRLTPRLTLTYGLRYEINPPPSERNGIDPFVVQGVDNPATAQLAPAGAKPYKTTYNNVAPRVGGAYRVSSSARFGTVMRGGFGVFYDLSSGQLGTAYAPFQPPFSASASLTNPVYPLTPAQAAAPAFSNLPPFIVAAFAPDLKLPYTLQWNGAIEQALGAAQTISAAYVAALGRRLYYTESFVRPSAVFTDLDITRNAASSDYHALQLQFQRRLTRGLQALASYTWSHSIDTGSTEVQTGNLPLALNPVAQNRGSSDFDRRHSVSAAVTYNIPTPKFGAAGEVIFKGWAVDSIYRALSAAPVNIFANLAGRGSITSVQLRPDPVPGAPLYLSDPNEPGGRRINVAAFTVITMAAGRQGRLGRNALRGFGLSQLDFTLRRQFNFTEKFNAQFRVELFNAFNQANFADPVGNLTNSLFGRSTQMLGRSLGGLNSLYQIGGPRSIQLAVRLQF